MSRQQLTHLGRLVYLLCLVLGTSWVRGDEPKKVDEPQNRESKDKPAAPTALQIAQWIKDLDGDDFQVRQQASGRLIAAGKHAASQVAKAAEGDSAEVTARCLDVLSKLLRSPDAETKAAAKKALQGVAKSKNAGAARQADHLLDPSKVAGGETPAGPMAIPLPPGVPRFEIGGIGIAGPGMRISVKTVDGNKTIEADEGGKKTKIEEAAKGGIKMEIETVDGKEKTSKYEAKDADELKKKYPEAHKVYEKYSKFAPGMAIRIGGLAPGGVFPAPPIPPVPGPGFAPAVPFRIGAVPQKALDQIEAAQKQLADASEKLRKLAEESRITPEAVKKLADQIDTAKKQLEEARAQLPK